MSDLISRSALIEEIESLTMHITGLRAGKGILSEYMNEYKKSVLRIIEEQPIAYDAEKVNKEILEYFKEQINKKPDGWDLVDFSHDIRNIVRNGGKE